MMTLDLNGRSDTVDETAIVATRDAAAARAASPSQLRDLSLMLDAALAGRSVPSGARKCACCANSPTTPESVRSPT
jgi:hypothetical protein